MTEWGHLAVASQRRAIKLICKNYTLTNAGKNGNTCRR
jgi:hypothetical protein